MKVILGENNNQKLDGLHAEPADDRANASPQIDISPFKFFRRKGVSSSILHQENTIWFILILSPIWRPIFLIIGSFFSLDILHLIRNPYDLINEYAYNFLLTTIILFLLVSFNVIFGYTPIQLIKKSLERRRLNATLKQQSSSQGVANTSTGQTGAQPTSTASVEQQALERALDSVDAEIARDRVSSYNSNQLLSLYALDSRKVAARSQARAGVFLFVGTIIAGLGLGFFYYFNVYIIKVPDFTERNLRLESVDQKKIEENRYTADFTDKFIVRLPGIAILFFIEFVALYFLRLFKSTTDEYRRYEEIARSRETTLVALKISFERGDNSDVKSIIEQSRLFSTSGRLAKDETTEFLENRKLQKDEIILLEGLLDVFKRRSEVNESKIKSK